MNDDSRRKILIITNSITGLLNFRGMLLQELRCEYKERIIVIPTLQDDNDKSCAEKLEILGYFIEQIDMDRRGVNPKSEMQMFIGYRSILKREQPGLVILYTIKPNIYGGISCRMLKIPYVINITGLGTAFEKGALLRRIAIELYKFACKKAKVVFFENSENQKMFTDYRIISKNQGVTLNGAGVDLDQFELTDYPKGDMIVFLFMGRIMAEKGVNELFSAMKKLISNGYSCELHMIGSFEEDYRNLIQKYEQEGWLHYFGFQKDVRPFIKDSHCFVLPSWHEGMANTNLESAASGRPVITSDIPGCREAVVEGKTGFLAKRKDDESLYKAMERFIRLSYEDRKAMGVAGRRHMEEVFDKRKVVRETVRYLQE